MTFADWMDVAIAIAFLLGLVCSAALTVLVLAFTRMVWRDKG